MIALNLIFFLFVNTQYNLLDKLLAPKKTQLSIQWIKRVKFISGIFTKLMMNSNLQL